MFHLAEVIIPAGKDVFHSSLAPDALLASGRFDAAIDEAAVIRFTPAKARTSNITTTVVEDLRVFESEELSDEEMAVLANAGDGNRLRGAEALGFDGSLEYGMGANTETGQNKWCQELLIFRGSLHKLANLRRLQGD